MKRAFSLVALIAVSSSSAHGLQLNGCWFSRDAVHTDAKGLSRACTSGIYMNVVQTNETIEVKVLNYSCDSVPALPSTESLHLRNQFIFASSDAGAHPVGHFSEERLSFSLKPSPDLDFENTLTWEASPETPDAGSIYFEDTLLGSSFVRGISGHLKPVRCLE